MGAIAMQPLVALIAGILILLVPRLLNYIVAIYLILIGIFGLWPGLMHGGRAEQPRLEGVRTPDVDQPISTTSRPRTLPSAMSRAAGTMSSKPMVVVIAGELAAVEIAGEALPRRDAHAASAR